MTDVNISTFAYRAATPEGAELTGTIDAADVTEAGSKLGGLRLRVIEIAPAIKPLRSKPMRGEDFISFNQHLAHLTQAGLPVEHGLRLIAQDVRGGRLAATINEVASDLERGIPLGEAFDRHRGKFPALYGRLMDAGVRSNNLAGMLFNLGRHVEMVQRLRASLWRVVSYPLMVLLALAFVLIFLSYGVLPQFKPMFASFGTQLPAITELIMQIGEATPVILLSVAVALIAMVLGWGALRAAGKDAAIVEMLVLPLPLIGPVLKRNLVARWCDATRLSIEAGLDLPAAIELANEAVGSPALRRDGMRLVEAMRTGQALDTVEPGKMLPGSVIAAMSIATRRDQLPMALDTLARMYEQQSEARLAAIPVVLTPMLLIFVAVVIGFVVLAMFVPLFSLIRAISGPKF